MNVRIKFLSLAGLLTLATCLHGMEQKQDENYLHSPEPFGICGIARDMDASGKVVVCNREKATLRSSYSPNNLFNSVSIPQEAWLVKPVRSSTSTTIEFCYDEREHTPVCAISSCGRWLAMFLRGNLGICDLTKHDEKEFTMLKSGQQQSAKGRLAFSPSGSRLLLCRDDDDVLPMWNMKDLEAKPQRINWQRGEVADALLTDENTVVHVNRTPDSPLANQKGLMQGARRISSDPMRVHLCNLSAETKQQSAALFEIPNADQKVPEARQTRMVQARNKPHILALRSNYRGSRSSVWLWDTHGACPTEPVLSGKNCLTMLSEITYIDLTPDARFLITYVEEIKTVVSIPGTRAKCMFLYKTNLERPSVNLVWNYQFDAATLVSATKFLWSEKYLIQANGLGSITRWELGKKMLEQKEEETAEPVNTDSQQN